MRVGAPAGGAAFALAAAHTTRCDTAAAAARSASGSETLFLFAALCNTSSCGTRPRPRLGFIARGETAGFYRGCVLVACVGWVGATAFCLMVPCVKPSSLVEVFLGIHAVS